MTITEADLPDADELGCMLGDLPDGTEVDNLALIIAEYFSRHPARPEGDKDTEDPDNDYWGDWVIAKCKEIDVMLTQEVRAKTLQKARIREWRQAEVCSERLKGRQQ